MRLAVALGLTLGLAAAARGDDEGFLQRLKRHEQELEQKIKTARDKPDKKAEAKKLDRHVEDNIRQLGREVHGATKDTAAAAEKEGAQARRDAHRKLGSGAAHGAAPEHRPAAPAPRPPPAKRRPTMEKF